MRLRSKAEAARPATLDEIIGLICQDEPALIESYGTLEEARARFQLLQARGEIPAGQKVEVAYLLEGGE